jgi:hypothetical protein
LLHSGDLGPATCRHITDLKRWFLEGADIRNDADIAEEMLAFVVAAGARSVVTTPCSPLQQSAVSP